MSNFKKVINPGKVFNWSGKRRINVFCQIEYTDGRLSITGVVGPRSSGNAEGGCGQITDTMSTIKVSDLGPGWTPKMLRRFVEIWDKWHLNDMRPNCEHQVGPEWDGHQITVVRYKLSDNTKGQLRRKIIAEVGNIYDLSQRAALTHLWEVEHCVHAARLLGAIDLGFTSWNGAAMPEVRSDEQLAFWSSYDGGDIVLVKNEETKWSGHTYPYEHPEGVLTKECQVCGYKYGTKWLREEVPQDVLDFLMSLPNTTITPAWV